MMQKKTVEIITPPNTLKAKTGGKVPVLDQEAIKRAEAALDAMSSRFSAWIEEEQTRLLASWDSYARSPGKGPARNELHRSAHDLKGLAPTYGYPLVGRICASLCKLTGEEYPNITVPDSLLKAHVDAVKAAIGGKVMGADHPVGIALATELEAQTKALIASQS